MKHNQTLKILLADDEKGIRITLGDDLKAAGHEVVDVGHGSDAMQLVEEQRFDLVITDIRMPGADGEQILKRTKELHQDTEVIVITGFGTIESAVEAMRHGAYHYILKPFLNQDILICVEKIAQLKKLEEDNRDLKEKLGRLSGVEGLIGQSREMQAIVKTIRTVAKSAASILIRGESGTGKEVIARTLHLNSLRANDKFVAISCGALPATLLESELFGHEKGSFTDAHKMRKGWFELADGGTIFLDDIDDMPMETQVKLLRAVQEREVVRVGGERPLKVDFRIIAATKRDLQEMMAKGEFREDLYYRLNVLPVSMPPLRERTGDIVLLAKSFVDDFNREFRRNVTGLSSAATRLLEAHPWPGNVRELRNAVERAVLLAEGDQLTPEDFLALGAATGRPGADVGFRLPASGLDIHELEQSLVEQALERTGGNQTRAGELLGLNRDQIRYRIEKFKLTRSSAADDASD